MNTSWYFFHRSFCQGTMSIRLPLLIKYLGGDSRKALHQLLRNSKSAGKRSTLPSSLAKTFQKIKAQAQQWNPDDLVVTPQQEVEDIPDTKYCSPDVRKEMEDCTHAYEVVFGQETRVVVHTYDRNAQDKIAQDKSWRWMWIAQQLFDTTGHQLEMFVWLTNCRKRWPTHKHEVVGSQHVNSGAAMHGKHHKLATIWIWREDEHQKLKLHELLHTFDIHFYPTPPSVEKWFCKKYQTLDQLPLTLFESWNEFVSMVLHCLFLALETDKGGDAVMYMLELEARHRTMQAASLLKHQGFTSWSQVCDGSLAWKQESHVFEYYVVVAAMLWNVRKCVKANKPWWIRHDAQEFAVLAHACLESERFQSQLAKAWAQKGSKYAAMSVLRLEP